MNLDTYWDVMRDSLGFARRLAERLDMGAMVPRGDLSSSDYCLACLEKGKEAVVAYLPSREPETIDLTDCPDTFGVEWLDTRTGRFSPGDDVTGGGRRSFSHPFDRDSVLYLKNKS